MKLEIALYLFYTCSQNTLSSLNIAAWPPRLGTCWGVRVGAAPQILLKANGGAALMASLHNVIISRPQEVVGHF